MQTTDTIPLEAVPDAVVIVDGEGRIARVNAQAEKLFGYSRDELIGQPVEVVVPERFREGHAQRHKAFASDLSARPMAASMTLVGRRKDGSEFPADIALNPLKTDTGPLFICAVRDITERKRMEQEAIQLRDYLQLQVNRMPIGLIVWDTEFRVKAWNLAATRIFGFAEEEVLGKHPYDLIVPKEAQSHVDAIWRRLLGADRTAHSINENVTKDGRTIICEWANTPLVEANGSVVGVLSMVQDVTERKRAQEMLQETSQILEALIESAPVAVIALDPDGNVKMWNPAAEQMFGWSQQEVLGRPYPAVPEDERDEFWAVHGSVLQGKTLTGVEVRGLRKDSSLLDLSLSVAPLRDAKGETSGIMGVAVDISERKRAEQEKTNLEAQLRQGQKMEAIGRLAGGIAHDFNNLLMVINGQCQLLLRRLGLEDPTRLDIEEINKAGDRAADLTRQLMAFSRKQVSQPTALDLNRVVAGIETMLRRLIGEDITLVTVLQPGLGRVRGDPGQMEQVLTNLVVNARDAMPGGGRLTVETANVELDEAYASKHMRVEPGPYVMLAVTDTGVGMDAETRSRIFEPFFTTKERGKGTGLGLATVYGIVEQHGGSIWVYSEPGRGTAFKVYLPRFVEGARPAEAARTPVEASGRPQTVLLVEDEDAVRGVVLRILQMEGYEVLEAHHAGEALLIAERHQGPIHLMVTDVVMPHMNGRELAERLAPLKPQMRVLYMSGYADNAILAGGALEPNAAFLSKPFTPDALARKVRELLAVPRTERG